MQLLGWVHVLLNVVGLLLWLRWREAMLRFSRGPTGGTLLGTLRPAGAARAWRWAYLGVLAGLVLARGLGYWSMGSGLGWNPSIDLVAITIPFRSDWLGRMFLFSLLSLVVFVAEFYFCLAFLSAVNRRAPDTDFFQAQLRAHLAWLERWPVALKLLAPCLMTGLGWAALSPLLARVGLVPAASAGRILEQAFLLGLAAPLVWQYLIAGLLLLHLVNSYVYLGNAPFWTFVAATARNLIGWAPLRVGRIDLAPLLGTALVLVLGQFLSRQLPRWYQALPL